MITPRKMARTIRALNDVERLLELAAMQQAQIDILQHEKLAVELGLTRVGRDLIGQFIVALDMPENHDELRETLQLALCDFKDEVARLEERTT